MPTPPPKSPFRCPACGFVQLEPPHLVSTNCRSCGAHYKASDSTEGLDASSGSLSPAGRKHETGKPVHCLKCGRTHQVSPKAQSTICPGCYAPIELIDVNITAHASRSIDTRGHLKITAKGSVSNPWIICGSARIEGPFHGHLRCEGRPAWRCKNLHRPHHGWFLGYRPESGHRLHSTCGCGQCFHRRHFPWHHSESGYREGSQRRATGGSSGSSIHGCRKGRDLCWRLSHSTAGHSRSKC